MSWSTEYLIQRFTFEYEDQPAVTVGYVLEVPLAEFSGVHNDLTGRLTAAAHPGTAVSIDPTGFNGNLDGTIVNAQLLAAAVDDLTTGGGGGADEVYFAVRLATRAQIEAEGATVTPGVSIVSDSGVYEAGARIVITDGLDDLAEAFIGDGSAVALTEDPPLWTYAKTGVGDLGGQSVLLNAYLDTTSGSAVNNTLYVMAGDALTPLSVTGGGGATTLDDLTDVDTVTDPPAQDDVLAWDAVNSEWSPATLSSTPDAHASTHANGGSDEVSIDASQVTSGTFDIARVPTGTTSTTVPLGNDTRLSDARTPTAHKTSHATGGSDALTASDIGAAAASHTHTGTQVTVDASGFNGNLTTSDDTLQEVAQKLDDLSIPAAGIADPGGANDDLLQRKSGAWTYRTPAQVKTDLGVARGGILNHGQNALPSGRYIGNTMTFASSATNFVKDKLWFAPFVPPFDMTIDRLSVEVTTNGGAGALGRIGIYTVTAGVPDALLLDAGTFDGSSNGVKEITLSPTQALTGGTHYALAFFHNSAANMAMRHFSVASGTMQMTQTAAGGNVDPPIRSWLRNLAFTTLPNPAGTVSYETVSPVAFYMRGV